MSCLFSIFHLYVCGLSHLPLEIHTVDTCVCYCFGFGLVLMPVLLLATVATFATAFVVFGFIFIQYGIK